MKNSVYKLIFNIDRILRLEYQNCCRSSAHRHGHSPSDHVRCQWLRIGTILVRSSAKTVSGIVQMCCPHPPRERIFRHRKTTATLSNRLCMCRRQLPDILSVSPPIDQYGTHCRGQLIRRPVFQWCPTGVIWHIPRSFRRSVPFGSLF